MLFTDDVDVGEGLLHGVVHLFVAEHVAVRHGVVGALAGLALGGLANVGLRYDIVGS